MFWNITPNIAGRHRQGIHNLFGSYMLGIYWILVLFLQGYGINPFLVGSQMQGIYGMLFQVLLAARGKVFDGILVASLHVENVCYSSLQGGMTGAPRGVQCRAGLQGYVSSKLKLDL